MSTAVQQRYYVEADTQFDYEPGAELYHVFDRIKTNDMGERRCEQSFVIYWQACTIAGELNGEPPEYFARLAQFQAEEEREAWHEERDYC